MAKFNTRLGIPQRTGEKKSRWVKSCTMRPCGAVKKQRVFSGVHERNQNQLRKDRLIEAARDVGKKKKCGVENHRQAEMGRDKTKEERPLGGGRGRRGGRTAQVRRSLRLEYAREEEVIEKKRGGEKKVLCKNSSYELGGAGASCL